MATQRLSTTIEPVEFIPGFQIEASIRTFATGQEIFAEAMPAERVHKVLSGAVRLVRILPDGRRHIVGFYLPGDIVGLDEEGMHLFSAEAAAPSRVASAPKGALHALAGAYPAARAELWKLLSAENHREREHALMLGRLTAVERVSKFLSGLCDRMDVEEVELPMSRTDIADYLGLTIETVSRTMTLLRRRGRIRLRGARQVEVSSALLAA